MASAQIGGVVAAVVVLLLSIALVFWYCRKYDPTSGLGRNGTTDSTAAAIRSRSQSKNSQTSAATTPKSSITATAAIEK